VNYEQIFWAVFSCFHGQKFNILIFFLHCRVRTKKLLHTKVKKKSKNSGSICFELKIGFLGLAVLVIE
jgi:hypothetical protein